MRLKICDSHLTCKVANECLNVRERVEVVEWNKRWSPPFPCCPVSRQCPWKKILIEKKRKKKKLSKRLWLFSNFAISLNFLSKNFALSCFIKLPVRYSIWGKYVECVLNILKLQTLRKISLFRFKNFLHKTNNYSLFRKTFQ